MIGLDSILTTNGYILSDWQAIISQAKPGDIALTSFYGFSNKNLYKDKFAYYGDRIYSKIVVVEAEILLVKEQDSSSGYVVQLKTISGEQSPIICSSFIKGFVLEKCNTNLRLVYTLMALEK